MATSNLSISCHFGTTPSSSAMDWFSWLSRTSLEPSLIYDYGLVFSRNELQLEDAIYFNHEFLQSMGVSIAKHRLEILKLVKKEEGVTAATRPNKKLSGVIKKYLRKCMSKLVSFREDDIVKKDTTTTTTTTPVTLPEPDWCQGKWRGALVRKQQQGSEDLVKEENHHHHHHNVPMYRSRSIALSGPLDGSRMQHHHEKMVNNKALKLSGPIDGRMNERMMMYTNRSPLMPRTVDGRFSGTAKSPRVSGPLDARVMMVENRSPRVTTRPSDVTRADTNSPMGYNSPYNNNKPKADFDYDDDDDDHTLWPTLFQDLKPT